MSEFEPNIEQDPKSSSPPPSNRIPLQQAVNFGEYDPEKLSNFSEWHTLSSHIQWQLVRKALDIRYRQLTTQYAELSNVLDYSKKPQIWGATKMVQKQIKSLEKDREKLYIEFSNKMTS